MTARIVNHLRRALGDGDVYHDVDSIPPGAEYRTHIRRAIEKCDVFIIVIGENWGKRGWRDEDDFHRFEIETALIRRRYVVPVFLEGAEPIGTNELPPSLQALASRQGLRIESEKTFLLQMDRLVGVISEIRNCRIRRFRQGAWLVIAALFLLIGATAGWWANTLLSRHGDPPSFNSSIFCQYKTSNDTALLLANKVHEGLTEQTDTKSLYEQCATLQCRDPNGCHADRSLSSDQRRGPPPKTTTAANQTERQEVTD